MPMPIYTFFDEYDLSGKRVIPFSSHGGSGLAGTVQEITSLEPDADVEQDAFTVSRNNVSESAGDIAAWLDAIGY